jgi:hypothetical protein
MFAEQSQPSPKIEGIGPLPKLSDNEGSEAILARLRNMVCEERDDGDIVQLPSRRWLKEAS